MFLRGQSRRALVGALTAIVACLLAAGWATGAGGSVTGLQARRDALRNAAGASAARAARLAVSVAAAEQRLAAVEADVAAKERELATTRAQLQAARARLAQLERQMRDDEQVLAGQIRASYEDGRPDVITVILEAKGFADLLERVSFLKRVRQQDVQVIHAVQRARRAVVAAAVRLGALELREQRIAEALGRRRDEVAAIHAGLVARHQGALAARARAVSDLQSVDRQLRRLQARTATASPGSGAPPPAPAGNGGFVFPLPKSAASSPSSWSLDDGVDIAAPGHTPLYAVGSGTIVLHGIGGFGSWAPVLHLDDGRYVYYGHAGPGNSVAVGTHVSAGAVIGEVGAGIVGISTGPHLEIGFASSGGSPIGPSSAPGMMQLLRGSY
jgi:murein DD-endopeptidase MepM/ murein hydrolase activator NlpD